MWLDCLLLKSTASFIINNAYVWASHGFDRGHAAEEASPTLMG